MPTRKKTASYKDLVEDADGALRSLSRRFPDALPTITLRPDEQLASAKWRETQVAVPQVRMDRVLEVNMVGGSSRLLHGEWTDRLTSEVKLRVGRYYLAVALAEQVDASVAQRCWQGAGEYQRIESMVVVLRGRKKPWPREEAFRTTPNDTKFGGAWFYVDAVYQRTVSELEARGSPFWLAFVPLAMDVNEEKLRRIVNGLKKQVDPYDFDELVMAMLSLAKLKKDSPWMMDVIRSEAEKEKPMNPYLRDGIERGMEKGLQQGLEQGLQQGLQKGRAKGLTEGRTEGRTEGLALLVRVFERRLGRSVTDRERRRLIERFENDGPKVLGDAIVDLSPKELADLLAPRKSSKRAG